MRFFLKIVFQRRERRGNTPILFLPFARTSITDRSLSHQVGKMKQENMNFLIGMLPTIVPRALTVIAIAGRDKRTGSYGTDTASNAEKKASFRHRAALWHSGERTRMARFPLTVSSFSLSSRLSILFILCPCRAVRRHQCVFSSNMKAFGWKLQCAESC